MPIIKPNSTISLRTAPWLFAVFVLALAVRGAAAWSSHGEPVVDVHSFWQWAQRFDAGLDPYTVPPGNAPEYAANYPPLWIYVCWGCLKVSEHAGCSFDLVLKLLVSLLDALTVIPVGLLALVCGASATKARNAAFFFAINPATILVASFHGQNDPVIMDLLMWASWLLLRMPFGFAPELAMLLVGTSLAIKPIAVLFLPLLLLQVPGWRRRAYGLTLAVLPSLLFWLPNLLDSPNEVLIALRSYRGVPDFGYVGIYNSWRNLGLGGSGISHDYVFAWWFRPFCLLVIGLVWWRCRRAGLITQVVVVTLTLYLIYGKLAAQYLMWVIPFGAVLGSPRLLRATLFTALSLAAFYQLHHPGIMSGFGYVRLPTGITIPQWSGIFLFAQVMLYLEWFRWLRDLFKETKLEPSSK